MNGFGSLTNLVGAAFSIIREQAKIRTVAQ
jgi:hypothetical protein